MCLKGSPNATPLESSELQMQPLIGTSDIATMLTCIVPLHDRHSSSIKAMMCDIATSCRQETAGRDAAEAEQQLRDMQLAIDARLR